MATVTFAASPGLHGGCVVVGNAAARKRLILLVETALKALGTDQTISPDYALLEALKGLSDTPLPAKTSPASQRERKSC